MADARAAAVEAWLAEKGWTPFPFQRETWSLIGEGRSGLVHATTGAGKTLAVGFGAWLAFGKDEALGSSKVVLRLGRLAPPPQGGRSAKKPTDTAETTPIDAPHPQGLTLLWITPMRALAADTERALRDAFEGVAAQDQSSALAWTVGARTGDTSQAERARQANHPPRVLITTPESLSLMLSRPDARETFSDLRCVVVDEWHELIGNKRGVSTQLGLARLRAFRPGLMIWGMSATLGNLDEAMRVLVGPRAAGQGAMVEAKIDKPLVVDTLIPKTPERFPWAGHLGTRMAAAVVAEIEAAKSTLVFTNVRSQTELWYQSLLKLRPDWAGAIALHHGSLSRETRDWVEQGLKTGALKAVVCTSSLDLGVDFLPVERVLQIGSPKGVARLLQRAGRSGHAPGRVSRVTMVPSHSLELIEAAAVKSAIAAKRIESRKSSQRAARCAGAALRDRRARRRLRAFRASRRSADDGGLRKPDRRIVGLVPRLRFEGRPDPQGLSRVPARCSRQGRRVARRRPRHRSSSPAEHRRHRQRRGGHRAIRPRAARGEARHGRRELCRPAARRRALLVRRKNPGVRSARGGDGFRARRQGRGRDARLGRRPDAAFDHARRRHGRGLRPRGERNV